MGLAIVDTVEHHNWPVAATLILVLFLGCHEHVTSLPDANGQGAVCNMGEQERLSLYTVGHC